MLRGRSGLLPRRVRSLQIERETRTLRNLGSTHNRSPHIDYLEKAERGYESLTIRIYPAKRATRGPSLTLIGEELA
jgi:hypothetical protein